MVRTFQYPQYLYALETSEASQNPDNGNWDAGSSQWKLKGICREETNGKGHTVQTVGGEALVFSSLIQIPKGTARINDRERKA